MNLNFVKHILHIDRKEETKPQSKIKITHEMIWVTSVLPNDNNTVDIVGNNFYAFNYKTERFFVRFNENHTVTFFHCNTEEEVEHCKKRRTWPIPKYFDMCSFGKDMYKYALDELLDE